MKEKLQNLRKELNQLKKDRIKVLCKDGTLLVSGISYFIGAALTNASYTYDDSVLARSAICCVGIGTVVLIKDINNSLYTNKIRLIKKQIHSTVKNNISKQKML